MIDLNIYFNERLFRYLSQTISVKLFLIWRIVELAMKVLVTLMQHTKQKKTFLTAIPTLSIGRAFSCCSKLLFLIWIWTIIFLFYFNCSIPSKYLEFYIISSLEYYLIEFRFARLRYVKVHIFWDGHNILWNLHLTFDLYFWQALHRTKVRWRFHKILWPSQNKWTVFKIVLPSSIFCSQIQSNILSLRNDKIILTF